jgi:2-keto-4-pentenoate hydratase
MSDTRLQALADRLLEAEQRRQPVEALSSTERGLTLEDAYGIQLRNAARHLHHGARLVGYKIGLTSREAQKQFGVFEPDFGHLFEGMWVAEEGEIVLSELIQPKIEGEVAFLMGRELKGPGATSVDALAAVDAAFISMEIVDSRIANWKIKAVDTIADNGSSSRFVVGTKPVSLKNLDLPLLGMALSKNGEVQVTGAGAAVMGNPLNAVAFLANELAKFDRCLQPGQIVLSGAVSSMIPLKAGEFYTCEMARLGKVSVRAVETRSAHESK